MTFCMFFSFYSIFCLGRTKNEVHICNLHSETQLLMYDRWGYSTKKNSSPEGGSRTVRKPGLKENNGFEWENLYFPYQWPKRHRLGGYTNSNSSIMHMWDPLIMLNRPPPLIDIMPNSSHGNQPLRIINIGGPHAIMPFSHHACHPSWQSWPSYLSAIIFWSCPPWFFVFFATFKHCSLLVIQTYMVLKLNLNQ